MLDTHEYDGVSVSKCGPECGNVIDRFFWILSQSVREGFHPSFGYKNNIAIRDVEPIPSRQSNKALPTPPIGQSGVDEVLMTPSLCDSFGERLDGKLLDRGLSEGYLHSDKRVSQTSECGTILCH
jgi:hypothetical protein